MTSAPIALFAYNRPKHLRKTLDALLANPLAAASELHIFCDAAKKPKHTLDVAAVRSIVRSITGFRKIVIVERESNFGLAKSIAAGVSSLCATHGRVIVLEDDLLVTPGFLRFMNDALVRYQNYPDVYQISGYMYPGNYAAVAETFFLPMTSCWGWATWKRAWSSFNFDLDGLDELKKDANLTNKFNLQDSYDYIGMAEQQKAGKISSWGVCWYFNVFMKGGLVLYPRSSFVQNIGVDSSGTHGDGHSQLQKDLVFLPSATKNLFFPEKIIADEFAYREVVRVLALMKKRFLKRLSNWIFK